MRDPRAYPEESLLSNSQYRQDMTLFMQFRNAVRNISFPDTAILGVARLNSLSNTVEFVHITVKQLRDLAAAMERRGVGNG